VKIKRASQWRATYIFSTSPLGCAILPVSEAADFLGRPRTMTTIPRDSDIIGATALLALVLVIGLVRVFG